MRKVLQTTLIAFLSILVYQSCSNSNSGTEKTSATEKEKLVEEIKLLEDTLEAKATQQINRKLAKDLIDKSKMYAEAYPDDELSPAYLFRAGNVAVGISLFEDAVHLFETVYQKYIDYDRAPDALFLEGFTYENHMNDIENAKRCYNEFLKRFPDDQLADQVRVVLENIGKSPEELVKDFQKK
jgi:TolA-binding protein